MPESEDELPVLTRGRIAVQDRAEVLHLQTARVDVDVEHGERNEVYARNNKGWKKERFSSTLTEVVRRGSTMSGWERDEPRKTFDDARDVIDLMAEKVGRNP